MSELDGAVSSWRGLGPVVPVPTVVLDRLLPALTDTELRVLLIVVRQTLGWADPSESGAQGRKHGRKHRDWISQSQFRERTGKSRDSISRAVANLVAKNLILVEDRRGEPLDTPGKRRSARDRLYYRLNPSILPDPSILDER